MEPIRRSYLGPIVRLAFAFFAVAACWPARAEDIDIFALRSSALAGDPNLLIVLDNSVNGLQPLGAATRFEAAAAALATAIGALTDASGRINVGLMLFNEPNAIQRSGARPTGAHDGAYVRYAMRTMTIAANRSALTNVLAGLGATADRGAGAHPTLTLEEARRYFGGLPVLNGFNTASKLDPDALVADGTAYASPVTMAACARNFVLFVANGPPLAYDAAAGQPFVTTLAEGTLPAQLALSAPPPLPVLPASQVAAPNWMDEFAALLRESPFPAAESGIANAAVDSIQTYGIAIHERSYAPDNQPAAASGRALVASAASRGGGRYRDAFDGASLAQAVASILAEVQAVNTVFGATALPAALNPQGTLLDQVYLSMFRPDAHASPRWTGNLKQYRFAYDSATDRLDLVDAQEQPAISAATGFIAPTARSFWSTPQTTGLILPAGTATVDFFANAPDGSGLAPSDQMREAPDGEVVDKGGAAQQLRSAYLGNQDPRNVFTCPLAGCPAGAALPSASHAFAASTLSCATHASAFGFDAASCLARLPQLLAWIRGADNTVPSNEAIPGPGGIGTSPVRPSVHGDVLHGKPRLINYGAAGIVAYYGANDGTLRAVRAGQPASGGGQELWAFVAPESFGKFRRLREGTPLLQMPSASSGIGSTGAAAGSTPKDYFFDGPVTHYETRDAAGNVSSAWLFAAARRGGTHVYAFDVTVPTAPRFLWKHASHDGTDPAFDDLGLTFSGAQAGRVSGHAEPVVVIGGGYAGGYDATGAPVGEDADPAASCVPSSVLGCANRIFVIDAGTGTLVASFAAAANGAPLNRSVAADVTLVDTQGTGTFDRAYAVDAGGGVWRIDFDRRGVAEWRMYLVARAGSALVPRKFLQAPEVVVNRSYAAILVGSGDREKPLATTGRDRFYMIKDKETALTVAGSAGGTLASWPIAADSTVASNMADVAGLTPAATEAVLADPANNGWFRALAPGEKVVSGALAAAGTVYFGTSTPIADSLACGYHLGTARSYGLHFTNGAPARDLDGDGVRDDRDLAVTVTGGGLPPTPVAGLVNVVDAATGRTVVVPFVLGAGGTAGGQAGLASPNAPAKVQVSLSKKRKKTYWYFKSAP